MEGFVTPQAPLSPADPARGDDSRLWIVIGVDQCLAVPGPFADDDGLRQSGARPTRGAAIEAADPAQGRRLAGGSHTPNSFGDYYDVSADTKQGLRGPVLIRARDLKVANHPVVFVSDWGVGPIFGTDPEFGPQYTELALDTSHPPASVYPLNNQQYVEWNWRQGVAKGWTGCVGFQIDGKNFSEDINVNVTPG